MVRVWYRHGTGNIRQLKTVIPLVSTLYGVGTSGTSILKLLCAGYKKRKLEKSKMTNTKNETMNAETETHLKLASTLNEIVELFTQKDKDLSEVERLQMFDDSLGYLCDNLGIDLDIYEEFKRGGITLENYEDLRKLDEEEPDETTKVVTVADELKELYSLNDSMFTGDPNHVPTYTDGTVIRQQDLADMNMNGLQRIAELIGIELGE